MASQHEPIIAMGESLLALVVILAILLALADTPLYPFAFGMVGIAGLYVLMEHPRVSAQWAKWAGSKIG